LTGEEIEVMRGIKKKEVAAFLKAAICEFTPIKEIINQ
jgi:hypothetical protein